MRSYFVCVIELDINLFKSRRFLSKNPNYLINSKCFYVGQSSRKPTIRFEQHKEGYKSNKFAKVYGLFLRKDLFEKYNPIPTREDALNIEKMIAIDLRKKLFGVWYN